MKSPGFHYGGFSNVRNFSPEVARPNQPIPLQKNEKLQKTATAVDSQGSTFHGRAIRCAAESARRELNYSLLELERDALEYSVIELFTLLAQVAPEMLPEAWAVLFDVIAAETKYWVYPCSTAAYVHNSYEPFMPYLNRDRLAADWEILLDHVEKVHAARLSGDTHELAA